MRRKPRGPHRESKRVHGMTLNIHENLRLTGEKNKKQTKMGRVGMGADDQRETLQDSTAIPRDVSQRKRDGGAFCFHLTRTKFCVFVCLFCFADAF